MITLLNTEEYECMRRVKCVSCKRLWVSLGSNKLNYIRMNYAVEQKEVEKAREQGNGRLGWSEIQNMKYTWRVAQELMRLTPPVFGNFKLVTRDTSFVEFDIPKGWQVPN